MIKRIQFTSVAAALLAFGLFGASQLSASPVDPGSSIQFAGSGNVSVLNGFYDYVVFNPVTVLGGAEAPTGSFAGTAGNSVGLGSFSYQIGEPLPTGSKNGPFFNIFTVNGVALDLTQLLSFSLSATKLDFQLSGYFANGSGPDVPATFTVDATVGSGGNFTIDYATASAPESGSTAVFLGGGILGLALLRRLLDRVLA